MKLVSGRATLKNGVFQLELNESCKCEIGLVEFNLPNINQNGHDENSVVITCDQIDSNFDNPGRILKNICLSSF